MMLRRLSHHVLEEIIPGYVLRLYHECPVSTAGFIKDILGNLYPYEGEIRQSSSGFSNCRICLSEGQFDLSRFSLMFSFKSSRNIRYVPLQFGEVLWLEVNEGEAVFKNQSETFMNYTLDHDDRLGDSFSFGMSKDSGNISFYIDGKKNTESEINIDGSENISLMTDKSSYVNNIFIYNSTLNDQQMRRLSHSFISSSSMLDGFGYLSTCQMSKMR